MATKVAAGLVIYRKYSGTIQYLLLRASYGDKHWTPPKGISTIELNVFLKGNVLVNI